MGYRGEGVTEFVRLEITICNRMRQRKCPMDLSHTIHQHHQLIQGSLADAKVYARDSCARMKAPSEEINCKSTLCDFLLIFNSNRDLITYC